MKPIELQQADRLIAFDRDGQGNVTGNGTLQLEGAVAVHNIVARNRFAYLADEVGMGKTYVALGVAALLRHYQPNSRVAILAPRENIQRKWIKESRNFVANNWRVVDNTVRGLDNRPARQQIACHSLADLARECCLSSHPDLFLRMTSFSPQLGGKTSATRTEGMRRARKRLYAAMPQLQAHGLDLRAPHDKFRDDYGRAINGALPQIDLLIVDEAHNYKHGYRERSSLRNHLTAVVFGHKRASTPDNPEFGARVQRVLLLSATPFEHDYRDLYNQLDVFGFADSAVYGADGQPCGELAQLADSATEDDTKRSLVRHFLVRRVTGLNIGNKLHTKNMYRREWRHGGLSVHDQPLAITDPKQRLVVALVQKKVAEVLGSERFNNRFQIGMLSSFESFLQSSTRSHLSLRDGPENESEQDEPERTFDGDQHDLDDDTRQGIDTRPLARILRSHHKQFSAPLPHPKLDATVAKLEQSFASANKALVFVRRLATMGELAARLDERYDQWLQGYMRAQLPELAGEVDGLFARYRNEKRTAARPSAKQDAPAEPDEPADSAPEVGETVYETVDDRGGHETFFAWFFRGKASRKVLSGSAFQRNRLNSAGSAYSTMFEDDHVAAVLGRPDDVLAALRQQLPASDEDLSLRLRRDAYGVFVAMQRKTESYPRLYVLEAYQVAGLNLLATQSRDETIRAHANVILHEAFPSRRHRMVQPPDGFPSVQVGIGVRTFVTLLHGRKALADKLLPTSTAADFGERFRQRERRRELLSALSRLGASYVELYLLAIRMLGSFSLSKADRGGPKTPEVALAHAFVDLLDGQLQTAPSERPSKPGFHAFHELSEAADAFVDIMSTNFATIADEPLWMLRRAYSNVLQNQSPVATSSRSKVKRLVQQFRMPGYPLVLVTTDILQEGEDLHTSCAEIMHYGITWTPSGMEQRTGRVDRIGSLAQRRLDGKPDAPDPSDKIQVYYPHLRDTVEVLQVERVLTRLNRFIGMVHSNAGDRHTDDREIDTASEMVRDRPEVAQLTHRLESAFPIDPAWLQATDPAAERDAPHVHSLLKHFGAVWAAVMQACGVRQTAAERAVMGVPTRVHAEAGVDDGALASPDDDAATQPFVLMLVPQRSGSATLVRCVADVGLLPLNDSTVVTRVEAQQRDLPSSKICVRPHPKQKAWHTTIECEMLFGPETTQTSEVVDLVTRAVLSAITLREAMDDNLIGEARRA